MKLHEACKRFYIDYDSEPDLECGSRRISFRTRNKAEEFVNSLAPSDRATLHVVCISHFEFLEGEQR